MTLRLLDLFSGIGGFSLAARWVGGFETVQFVERDPYCQQILCKHWPEVPIHDDITTFSPLEGSADVICGGFPCQDISLAGRQAGIKHGTRSGLFYELMRVVCLVRPRYIVLENVSAILSNGLDAVLGELAEAGFDAEWACISASAVGACHRRDRWWLVAYTNNAKLRSNNSRRSDYQPAQRLQGWEEVSSRSSELHEDAAHPSSARSQRTQYAQWGTAKQLCPDWGGYLSEPVLRRGDDGLRNRVDRLKALGNAVVPQVAMIPLLRVKELSMQHNARPRDHQ